MQCQTAVGTSRSGRIHGRLLSSIRQFCVEKTSRWGTTVRPLTTWADLAKRRDSLSSYLGIFRLGMSLLGRRGQKKRMQLRDCRYCGQTISATAIYCPACRRSDEVSVNFLNSARKTAWATAIFGMALVGPNAIAGAFLGTEMNRPTARTIRKIASKIGAIDSVSGGLDYTVFFTRTGFVPMLLYDLGRNPNIPAEIPYADFIRTHTEVPNAQGEVNGCVEYRTPKS